MSEIVYKSGVWKVAYPILTTMAGILDFIIPSSNPDAEIYNGHSARETLDIYLQQKGVRKPL
jgi:hypothetical protein